MQAATIGFALYTCCTQPVYVGSIGSVSPRNVCDMPLPYPYCWPRNVKNDWRERSIPFGRSLSCPR